MSGEHSNGRPPSASEAIDQARRPISDTIAWPDNCGLDPEAAILADCEALVGAGVGAEWLEEEPDGWAALLRRRRSRS